MKKKYLILMGLLCSWVSWQPADAQTDVTAQYIKNADFNDQSSWITNNISAVGVNPVSNWTTTGSGTAWFYGGAFQYGSGIVFNSVTVPASNPSGQAEGGCLGLSVGWGNTVVYTQNVTLPAGYYRLNYLVYNANKNANVEKSLIGFKFNDNTYYCGTSYPENEWTSLSTLVFLPEDTSGDVSIGFQAGGSSNDAPKLFVDNVTLEQWGLKDATPDKPEDFSMWLKNDRASWGASGTYGEYPERYTNGAPTGEYLSNTLTKLPVGVYDLVINCCASSTSPRDGNVPAVTDGDTRYATLSANNVKLPIPSYNRTGVTFPNENETYELTDIKVTDGILKIAATINEAGPNWFVIKSVSLKYKGADLTLLKEALADALVTAKAVDQTQLNTYAKTQLNNAITAAENVKMEEKALKEATDELLACTTLANSIAKEYPTIVEQINLYISVRDNSVALDKTAFNKAIEDFSSNIEAAKTVDELKGAVETLEVARQTYVLAAQPATEGFTFDYTFLIAGVGNSTNGWTKTYNCQNFQYQNASDKNTGDYVKQGYVETWDGAAYSGTLTYTKTGLPVGSYTQSAYAFGNENQGEVSLIANDASVKLASTTSLYQNPTLSGVKVGEDGKLTFGLEVKDKTWVGITNIILAYEGCDYNDYLVLKQEAESLVSQPMLAALKENLRTGMSLQATATRQEIAQAVVTLQATIPAARTSVANYAYLQRETTTAKSFGIDVATQEAAIANGTYDDEAAVSAAQALNVATYNKVKESYAYDVPVEGWAGEIDTTSGQHWSGGSDSYYDTNGEDINRSLSTAVTLPAGEYVLMAAGRSRENATMELKIDDTTVKFTAKGDTGYGIETSGQANFSENGTYANGGAGRGWEWEFVHLYLTEEKTVNLSATITTTGWAWGSFSDISLKMDKTTFEAVYYLKLQAALEECKPWNTGNTYADTTYPGYESAYNNKTYKTVEEIEATITALKEAFDAYALENADAEHPYDVTDDIIKSADCAANDPDWPGSGRETDKGQHWSGDASRVYFCQNHESRPARSQKITLNKVGAYLLKTSVRIVKSGAYATISVNDASETTNEVLGTTGGTIATDGTEWNSVEEGIAAGKTFANGNKGYGWVYNDLYFGAVSENDFEKTISINLSDWNSRNHEANCGGMKLYYIGKNHVNIKDGVVGYYGVLNDASVALTDNTPVADLSQAAVANVTVDRVNPNGLVYATSNSNVSGNNVIVDGTCANLVLADGHPFSAPKAFTATKAAYTMTKVATTAGGKGFGTLCLPFEVTGQAYKLDQGVTAGGELYATKVTTVPANTPVLVTAQGAYSGTNVTVAATKADAAYEAGELVGVYTATPAPVGSFVLQKHGDKVAFYPVVDVQPTVNPFRAYIRPQGEAASLDMLSVVFGFGDVTAIEGVESAEGVKEVSRYDAAGVRIHAPRKGMNIVRMSDGSVRKVLVK